MWVQYIYKGRTMEMKQSDRTSEAVSDQLTVITMADLRVAYSTVMQHLKQTGKVWKKLNRRWLVSLLKIRRT